MRKIINLYRVFCDYIGITANLLVPACRGSKTYTVSNYRTTRMHQSLHLYRLNIKADTRNNTDYTNNIVQFRFTSLYYLFVVSALYTKFIGIFISLHYSWNSLCADLNHLNPQSYFYISRV